MLDSPLAGVRVIELGRHIAGPYCGKLLAGMGAEVIKVEAPGVGDPSRRVGPFPEDLPHPEKSGHYLYLNTAKKSITLNLESETGRGLLKKLVGASAVLIEDFEPAVLSAWGLDYDSLAGINPALVLTSITGFGQTGPYRDMKADEITAFAMGGLMSQLGFSDMPPLKFGGSIVQYSAGLSAFTGSMVALFHAEMTGIGQQVDISLMEVIASSHFQSMAEYIYTGSVRNRSRTIMIFPCMDGYVNASTQAHQWPGVPEVLGMPELLEDPRFKTVEDRVRNADELEATIIPWMVERTKEEIYHLGQAAHLPWGYLANAEDLVNSPQYRAREFFTELEHPAVGAQLYPGTPLRMGDFPWQHKRAPLLGEHNEEVFTGLLDLSHNDLVLLRQNGVI